MRRVPSLRTLFGVALVLIVVLGAALVVVTVLQRSTATARTAAEHQRVTSFALSDQMRQSSNDLTRMVRLYVTTGDPRYRRYYDEILAIRRGAAPRPVNYDSSFWDRVLADGEDGVRYGPAISLTALMRRAHFAPGEFTALDASLRASDRLAELERQVMAAVAPRIAQGVDRTYLGDVAPQYTRLVDANYHREKKTIMGAIERFTALVDARTADRSAALTRRTDRLLLAQAAIIGGLALVVLLLLVATQRLIARPLARLTGVTRRITGGDWSGRADSGGVRELRRLAGNFNAMADAVETELTGRRAAEREALDAGRRLQTIADRVPGAVFQFHVDTDDALSVRFASRHASIHGAEANAGVDFPTVAQAVLADDRGAWLDSMVIAARAGGAWQHEYRVHGNGGGIAWMQAQAVGRPAGDGSGELYGYVTDITAGKALEEDLRRAREEAEAADRAKTAFLTTVSHELRTPLVAVSGTLDVLAMGELDDEQRDLVEVAGRSARSLLALIGDVLDLSKIEAGALDLVPAPVALGTLVTDTVSQHRAVATAKGLTVAAEIDGRLAAAVEADGLRIRQVVGNLIGNAIKFTERGGVDVRVAVVRDEGTAQRVAITVRDTGIGVSPEDRRRLFAPFTQLGTRRDGTGLGLAICRQLVEAMGGAIAMESTPGAGTTLRVELLLVVCPEVTDDGADRPRALRARPSRADAEADGSVLLLVEDHPVNRRILTLQLEAMGFVCDAAPDAEVAAERFAATRYGAVLCDIQLPGADGYELTSRLRAHEASHGLGRTPIVALTASALRGERERCRAAGMDDLVVKPASTATMLAALRRWLPHLQWPVETAAPALEPGVLDELTAGDPDLRDELLTGYLESLRDDLDAIATALDAGDAPAVRRRAHQIAGASRTVGAAAVVADAVRVERCDGDADALRPLAAALATHLDHGGPACA